MSRIAGRDAAALAELYDLHGRRVYSLALLIVGEAGAAQEVTQDAFLRLWERPGMYRFERGSFASYLLAITRNLAIDRLRRERRASRGASSIDDDAFPELPDHAQADELRWRDVQQAMSNLPADQRAVITLAFYHGLSQSDIAAHLSVPLGTIKTRMRLAMDKLRAAFASK